MLLSKNTTIPPPSTVSIVRASRFGVSASKSWGGGAGGGGGSIGRRRYMAGKKGGRSHLKHTHAVRAA